jgi:hypothetical protein
MGVFKVITISFSDLEKFVKDNVDAEGNSRHSAIYVSPASGRISVKVKEVNKREADKLGNTISLLVAPQKVKDANGVYSLIESENNGSPINVGGVKEITYQDKPR